MSYHQYNSHYQRNTGYTNSNSNNNNYQQRHGGYGYQSGFQDNRHTNRSNNYSQREPTRTHPINNASNNTTTNNALRSTNQLYMGDLDFSWTQDTIKEIWKTLGEENIRVKMMMNNNNNNNNSRFGDNTTIGNKDITKNQGYCFIEFSTNEQAANALLKNGMNIPSFPQRRLKLNWGSGGNVTHSNNTLGTATATNKSIDETNNTNNYSLFVGDLAPNVTESQLYELFNDKYPTMIERARVMIDRITGVSKGYGFVKFINSNIQSRAMIELQGTYLNGRAIKINSTGQGRQQTQPFTDKKLIGINEKYPNKQYHNNNNKINKLSLFMLPVQQLPKLNHMTDPNNTTLYISKISPYVNESDLEEYFKPFGPYYNNLQIFKRDNDENNINTNDSKSYRQGIVQYVNRYDAERAMIALHQYPIDGIPLQISWGLPIDVNQYNEKTQIHQDIQFKPQPSYPDDVYTYV
ncbi:similar to Saccharomyces cerevisiae YHR086W NAM8 RNA binding protein, component of the U1 snRNP protein [Maudiozyma saulgeensis]|uniref:Similar to Saccharomyces cerevisiae YHR086W NAM8 RNA binding protein, component of the U1 snRNP protein n=1 Tax=Maudiozyma saulgeensis TaxID=1789683 RepID=A0A1X7QX82_9SACH|nr:similar to Saccharomyces cerevisiae YHR086W NAM8 RNA binding protein, component of the U1 snRNP protein [Kazachstania saulgeensis]